METISNAEFDLFELSLKELNDRQVALQNARSMELQRLHYEADRAQRQYELCDPENRLVASELERR